MSEPEKPQVVLAPLQNLDLGTTGTSEISEAATLVTYDDANQLILVLVGRPGHLRAYDVSNFPVDSSTSEHSEPVWVLPMNEGAEPKLIRCSMGGADVVGIQRGRSLIEFIRRDSGNMFVSSARAKNAQILGFFWAYAPQCDLVIVTNQGLEQYTIGQEQRLKYITVRNAFGGNIQWYKYTHETRLALAGVNTDSNKCKLSAYQFVSTEVVRIPQFELSSEGEGRGQQIQPKKEELEKCRLAATKSNSDLLSSGE
eukprot:TRINITY_DN9245_c0_g1_i7.p2 TRINITY_DN9245_c0_g1~~TRINITY_DN9245_c0_g1_i7.p2  ORF type:complete len:255 (-),score=34.16 TRINITY_DN9245_c0_g1_i7:12-776(-)